MEADLAEVTVDGLALHVGMAEDFLADFLRLRAMPITAGSAANIATAVDAFKYHIDMAKAVLAELIYTHSIPPLQAITARYDSIVYNLEKEMRVQRLDYLQEICDRREERDKETSVICSK